MTTAAAVLSSGAPLSAEPSVDQLDDVFDAAFEYIAHARRWPLVRRVDGIALSSGFLPGVPTRAYRSDLELDAPSDQVVRGLADETFEQLALWSDEFMHGERLETLSEGPDEAAWVVRASYRTPAVLAHREYLYYFARRRLDDDRVIIVYRSVASDVPVQSGFVRGVLYPTAHLVHRLPRGRSRLEHVLANDLRGIFPRWLQNGFLQGALLDAHQRDSQSQRALWETQRTNRASA